VHDYEYNSDDPGATYNTRGDSRTLRVMLEKDLRSGRWQENDRLPTERELCTQYPMARNTVRRALGALEEGKFITRHVGRGTSKSHNSSTARTDPSQIDSIETLSPADVIECRPFFEPRGTRHESGSGVPKSRTSPHPSLLSPTLRE